MALKFCEKCGGTLRIQKINNEVSYSFCDNCQNFDVIPTTKKLIVSSKEKIEPEEERGSGVKKDRNDFATYSNICPKCGYDKAQILDIGIFYSDEDNLILLKCGKCGFCERVGRKTS